MLKFKTAAISQNNVVNRTRRLIQSVVLGGAILSLAQVASASPAVNSFSYAFRTTMTNNAVDADARGTVRGNLNRRGAVDNQRLKITVSKLDADTTYYFTAFLNDGVIPVVTNFVTDHRGGASVMYIKNPGAHPLPTALDPISTIRELDIVNTNGDTVLQADLTNPNSFSYSVKQSMLNTGFIPSAGGVAQLRGSPRATRASVTATGLTPLTSYQLIVNGAGATNKTSDAHGHLTVTGPKVGLELVLDIRTLALADSTGTNIILTVSGLGIPSGISTAGEASVFLGAAATYAVLAGSTITSINSTTVNGNLGLAPGSAVTGFPPGIVNGTIDAGNTAATLAKAALTVAYNDAKGRSLSPVSVAGNLGGQTLAPGLYKSTSSLEVSSGDLTLDAQGDTNGIFIFQIASTLTTTAGRQVILSGGAKAANVFWQVGSSAVLATTTAFKGTIMADQSITLNAGATLDGRALARIGAVTMDSSTITIPAP